MSFWPSQAGSGWGKNCSHGFYLALALVQAKYFSKYSLDLQAPQRNTAEFALNFTMAIILPLFILTPPQPHSARLDHQRVILTLTSQSRCCRAPKQKVNPDDLMWLLASLLVARTLLGAPGLTTKSKDATRGSWPYY